MLRVILAALPLLLPVLAGCAVPAPPPMEVIQSADIGEAPSADFADGKIRATLRMLLKDPDSAIVEIGEPKKAWYSTGGGKFAWHVVANCNARNSYGGYTGYKPYHFWFLGNTMVAFGASYEYTTSTGAHSNFAITEMNGGGKTAAQAGVLAAASR